MKYEEMIWERVRGHAPQVEMFRRSIRAGRFSQGYLLLGPDGIGKRLFVRTLAQCFFCTETDDADLEACGNCSACKQIEAGSHPDFLTVGCPEGKNIFPIELIAGSKERRGREGLCYDISLRPMNAHRRIALIDDAHLMNAESANALLKTLEEPPPFATLFLLAPQAESLLPTVRSRCQSVRFAPLSDTVLCQLLLEQGSVHSPEEAGAVAALAEGSLTLAGQLLDPEIRKLREGLFNGLSNSRDNPLELSKAMLDGIDELGGDAHQKRQSAGWLIRFALEFFRRLLRQLTDPAARTPIPQVETMAKRLQPDSCSDVEMVMDCLDQCVQAESQIARNAPAQMVFECLFDELARKLRPFVAGQGTIARKG